MTPAGSGSRRSKGAFLDLVDSLTRLGLQLGGAVFVVVVVYLLWGVFTGSLTHMSSLGKGDQTRIWGNVEIFCEALTISGLVLIGSAAVRFYSEEITGYLLLIGGAAFYWGIPMLVGSSLQLSSLGAAGASPLLYIVSQFQFVGVAALVVAVPFIMADFWYKLRGIQRSGTRGAQTVRKEADVPKSHIQLFCWQTPYCRDYLRRFCKAYEQRKSCWRIKSGCYCDEDLILRVMKKDGDGSKAAGFDQRYTEAAAAGKSRQLTAAQKRQRCRECFLYAEHQRQKYRLLSPLVFPVVAGLMWMYLKPVKSGLEYGLTKMDKWVQMLSMHSSSGQAASNQWANTQGISEFVLWVFLICIGMVIMTYVLRGLEYAIFDMQI